MAVGRVGKGGACLKETPCLHLLVIEQQRITKRNVVCWSSGLVGFEGTTNLQCPKMNTRSNPRNVSFLSVRGVFSGAPFRVYCF